MPIKSQSDCHKLQSHLDTGKKVAHVAEQRLHICLDMMYKITHQPVAIPSSIILITLDSKTRKLSDPKILTVFHCSLS